jgi:hypothetical protein
VGAAILLAAFSVAAGAGQDPSPRDEGGWLAGETAHYRVYVQKGCFNPKTKEGDGQILEDVKSAMEVIFGKFTAAFEFTGDFPGPAVVRVYRDRASYLAHGGPPTTSAHYDQGRRHIAATCEDGPGGGTFLQVLCHEGFHQFCDLAYPGFNPPPWFSEGLADGFGSGRFQGKSFTSFTLAGLAGRRAEAIRQAAAENRHVPLPDLLAMEREQFLQAEELHYAQSWAFVHFLWNAPSLQSGNGTYRGVVVRLMQGFAAGRPRDEVYREAFRHEGQPLDLGRLEAEWKRYSKALRAK